ncbi:MAG: RluA family pseudouridine synthase [Pirellulales bacterium]
MSDHPVPGELIERIVSAADEGARLDWFLAREFPIYSRVHLRKVINAAAVQVDGKGTKAAHRLQAGQRITLTLPELPRQAPRPENIPLDILHEDESIIVVNKRPGMVVHPARGHWSGTLTSALAHHFTELSTIGGESRPGIVHRLDRDTSGVMVVARTDFAHKRMSEQFESRTIEKEYFAIVVGRVDRDRDRIDQPIGFHPYQREKMAIRRDDPESRPAVSFYEVQERFDGFTAVRMVPKTGRTHQIRVHMSSIGHAVLCDRLYGGRAQITRGELLRRASDEQVVLQRQALHAQRIAFLHPATNERVAYTAPLPADLEQTLAVLRSQKG